ncbi:hypothetical protein K2173_002340 [Erythroxylum novogranatense]|uniref:Uncharacterized protein n=1 Tax=Erythroxylum novogranatense TaxID=1862640 RepID=A0AAV8T9V3_9ROSI|nr:hypothetical protein K2173_002340 [Erythroxylum novogranatense]
MEQMIFVSNLGGKRLQEYNPAQRSLKYLSTLAEGNGIEDTILSLEDELEHESYYPSLPFAALFSSVKMADPFSWQAVHGPPPDMLNMMRTHLSYTLL